MTDANAATPAVAPTLDPSIWAVIAAYNESETIAEVIAGLAEHGCSIVVVDDGSRDETAELARAAGSHVVRHPINLGQGAALQTGMEYALRRGAATLVTFDADGQHLPSDVHELVGTLHRSGADMACGSRFLGRTENMPRLRRATLKLATVFTYLSTGLRMTDAHNGLRAMTRACALRIQIRQNRMAHASEIIDQAAQLRLKLVEVPVTIRYSAYSLRKGQKISNSLTILLDLLVKRLYR